MAIVSFFLLRAIATERLPTVLVLAATIGALRLARVVLRARTSTTSLVSTTIGIGAVATAGKVCAPFQNSQA